MAGSRTQAGLPLLRTFVDTNGDGTYNQMVDEVVPFSTTISDGVRVALGDFDGDGNDELVAATDKAGPVKIFELGSSGELGARIDSESGFAHGTFVAAGDVNGDSVDELVTAGGPNDHEVVKIRSDLDGDGTPDDVTDSFNAYPATRHGGVRVALGNVSNSGGRGDHCAGAGRQPAGEDLQGRRRRPQGQRRPTRGPGEAVRAFIRGGHVRVIRNV